MEGGHAIERKLDAEKREPRLFEDAANGFDCPVGEIAVCGNIDFLYAVLLYELATDSGELLAQEGLAARKVKIFDRAEILGEGHNFVVRQIVPLIELLPIEAVLALHVAK